MTGIITLKSVTAIKLIAGEPVILVQNGKILEKNMIKLRYNQDDLMMQLRGKDIFDMNEVDYPILEPHGKLSVLNKSENLNVTLKDLNIRPRKKGISTELIRDGRIQEDNLKAPNLSNEWLFNELIDKGVGNVKVVFLATITGNGELYIDQKNDKLKDVQKAEEDDSIIK
ncbi:DUF421 domain-containing protein [Serpentinicella alkaliphila]|uniref:DUF421 domain-containing protein n=1 Tax=Serpentinicella alkaliphila TaxID=1734049 RepID=UPI001A9BEF0A|nr:YetF domain-containing protein [Serpentinicella alkaliphila]